MKLYACLLDCPLLEYSPLRAKPRVLAEPGRVLAANEGWTLTLNDGEPFIRIGKEKLGWIVPFSHVSWFVEDTTPGQ